jgi:D-serine dehydratase
MTILNNRFGTDDAGQLQQLASGLSTLWINPSLSERPQASAAVGTAGISQADTLAAEARFLRFAPLLARLFPELASSGGRIESGLLAVPDLQAGLGIPREFGALWVKADHSLPVAGSIKARGGFHEVLEFAEKLATQQGILQDGTDYLSLGDDGARALFNRYEIAVGSTGNLGLSIGVMASALGFRATVHMSADAKAWKKDRLRARGVKVVEHAGDYEEAVAAGRRQAAQDPFAYFVDDERSLSLLLGYSAAAPHLGRQLDAQGIRVDAMHPLFVYLPCGVGGAPGGITFGLKQLYGANVHCFFAEPTQSPSFLLRMMDQRGTASSVYDIGLTNRTEADGLAVPRASDLAANVMRSLLSGVYTVRDETLFHHLYLAGMHAGMHLEPSAAAGFSGPGSLLHTASGKAYLERRQLLPMMGQATHIAWTTGGLFVPESEYRRFYARGAALAESWPGSVGA